MMLRRIISYLLKYLIVKIRILQLKRIFLRACLASLREKCGGMWVARDESENILTSRIWIWDNKRAYAWSAASNQEFRDSGANRLLFVSLLEEMQKMGFHQVNMMHGNTQRLSYHATGYNPILVPYYSVARGDFVYNLASTIQTAIMNRR